MKKTVIIAMLTLSLFSCSDNILDITPTDKVAESAVWTDASLIRAYHNTLYAGIGTGNSRNMLAKACDEMAFKPASAYPGPILDATSNGDNITNRINFGGTGSIYTWNLDYDLIRKINVFIEVMKTNSVLAENEKNILIAEAKFIRAFMYFKLTVRYGGVPLISKVFTQNDEFALTRNTIEECVAFIKTDLDAALPLLPVAYHGSDPKFGKVTQGACKALLSRLYLYMASPLFSSSSKVTWKMAADAALDLIDDNTFSLHSNYATLFNANSGAANNEVIFARTYTSTNFHSLPMIYLGRRFGGYGGWSADGGISQNLVDDYDMANGEPAYLKTNFVNTTVNPASGYDPQKPYLNRDPRFYQSVLYDGATYQGFTLEMWESTDAKTWGFDSYRQSADNPKTSYMLRKFMPEQNVVFDFSTPFTTPFIWFRLGEIYLNYAEAKFELGDEATCREYINKIRTRANMPSLPNTVTGEELRKRLYNERRIELAFEEHRYFDVRRWGIAKFTAAVTTKGITIKKDVAGVKTYTPYVVNANIKWADKLNFIPVETTEILKNNNTITQTPGY